MITSSKLPASLADFGEQLRKDETEAFTTLYTELSRPVFDYLVGLTKDRVVSEDLLQETFLQAWSGRHSFKESMGVRPWIYGIASHNAFRYLKRRRDHVPVDDVADELVAEGSVEDAAASSDASALVWAAAGSLKPHHRAALDLSVRHGFNTTEIGEILEMSPARANDLTIRSREALGTAVRTLLVVRQREACSNLRYLIPRGVKELSEEQHASVAQHMRMCPECQSKSQQLTQPAELFGGIILLTLPETARQFHALIQHAMTAAAQTIDTGPSAANGFDFLRCLKVHRMAAALALGSMAVGGVGGAVIMRQVPPTVPHGSVAGIQASGAVPSPLVTVPAATATPLVSGSPAATTSALPTPEQYWAAALTTLRNASSYHISYTTASLSEVLTAFDITVGQNGDWYGTVTEVDPHTPFTIERHAGRYYLQGGPNVVAASPNLFSLTITQAQNLGTQWIALDTVEPDVAALIDRDIAPYVDANSLATMNAPQSTPMSAGTGTSRGQPVITLSDGTTTMTVTTGTNVIPLSITNGQSTIALSQLSQPVVIPQLAPLVNKNQLG